MRGRRRFLTASLAALAVLLLAGIGAGAWVASSDDDDPPALIAGTPSESDATAERPAPAEEPPAPGEQAPQAEGEPAPSEPAAPDPSAPEPSAPEPSATAEPEPAEPQPAPAEGQPERTRFRRERRRDPDRRGKRFSVPPAHEFTGTGNALIGTVDVREPAIVRWKARGRFGLEFGREAFPIIAPSKSGQLVVPPYRFDLVRVLAKGPWTITVMPQR
jgi:hypothetical protein